jgi:hypothetical protein
MTRAREEVRGATVENATPLGAEDWERELPGESQGCGAPDPLQVLRCLQSSTRAA